MTWKEQLNKAVNAITQAAESEKARSIAAKAKDTTQKLVQKAKAGALDAAQAFIEANTEPSTLKIQFLNANVNVVSPSDGIEVTRPNPATLVIGDGEGNGVVINAAAEPAYVTETIGNVQRLGANTFDLGVVEDGINAVVIKI